MSAPRTALSAARQVLFAGAPSKRVLDLVGDSLDPLTLLSPAESARSSQLSRQLDRQDFLAARALTRLLLRHRLAPGSPLSSISGFSLSQSCSRCAGPHGRPTVDVDGVQVSWAHSHGFVAAAVGHEAVGVDIEALGQPGRDASALPAWVRSEAIVKWGHGNLDEAAAWRHLLDGPPAPRGRPHRLDAEGRPHPRRSGRRGRGDVVLTDTPRNGLFVGSVAATTPARWVDPLG